MGQFGNCMYCCQFYFFVDCCCVDVQCVVEDEWEVKYVVDLVRVVGVVGIDDGVIVDLFCQWWQNFWFWVGQGEDQWCVCYFFYYFLSQYFWVRVVEENVGVVDYVIEGVFVIVFYCIGGFGFCYVWFMVFIDNVF